MSEENSQNNPRGMTMLKAGTTQAYFPGGPSNAGFDEGKGDPGGCHLGGF